MKLQSLKSKLLLAVFTLVLGSGLLISLLVTHRYSVNLLDNMVNQGQYLSKTLALEATDKILTNDVVALQKLLSDHQSGNNPNVAYLFVVREGRVLAHTFAAGFPMELIDANTPQSDESGNILRIASDTGEEFLDFAWPVLAGQGGTLRIGISEKPYRIRINRLWLQIAAITIGILIVALGVSYLFIRRFTEPLTALAEAAEGIGSGNMDIDVKSTGEDEIGRLTTSFNHMIVRLRNHTQTLEKKAVELDRAQGQTRRSFEIIQKIGTQSTLQDVCSYLVEKLQRIVTCSNLMLLIISRSQESVFAFTGNRITVLPRASFDDAWKLLEKVEDISFIDKHNLKVSIISEAFPAAHRLAAFPVNFENQLLGTLLVGCPKVCRCNTKDLEVMNLILQESAGAIKRAARQKEDLERIKCQLEAQSEFNGIVGKDTQMQTIYRLIQDIAPTDATVMIQGESGTGKELVARAIHDQSLRKASPFIVINCSAYPTTLLESEIFGHERGAFTGALRQKSGRFEQADGGTVFLDEIGEIQLSAQIKLLRVIQTQKFERLGGEKTLGVNVRIIAATNKDLLEEVKRGNFREDLFYRLNVIPIQMPPLRNRRNDIPLLARHFLHRFAVEQGKKVQDFSSEAMRMLLDYSWPGNVRELENSIEHALVLAKGERIEATDMPSVLRTAKPSSKKIARRTILDNEKKLLQETLEECGWNKKLTAQNLGISRSTLYSKLKKYRILMPTIH
jgi:DNA-binding NtrC family response regulator/HAMP domain-containing protein